MALSGSAATKYRRDIDGLRAVAVVPVVLYHAGLPGVTGGFVGVDVFFVISGFLITGILMADLSAGRFSIVAFYERRARRILPALMAVILACFVGAAVLATPLDFIALAKSATATALFGSNIWFWRSSLDYFASAAELEPLLHTWSLAVEEQFYIVFPIFLWALFARPRFVLVGAVAAGCALSLALAVWGVETRPAAAFYLSVTRAWELGLGVLLALGVAPVCRRGWVLEAVAIAGLAAILAAVALYGPATPFPGFAALLPCAGAAALIWTGMQGPTRTAALLSLRPIVFVGLISYSLYLWHWPILAFVRLLLGRVALPPAVAALAVAASFVIAAASWAYIERPFRLRPPIGRFHRPAIFASSAAALGLVLVLAAGVWTADGFPQRLSPETQAVLAAAAEELEPGGRCFEHMPQSGLCPIDATDAGEAKADFLLWGDSHALAALPGIESAARAAGRIGLFAGRSACPPLLGLNRVDRGPAHNCSGFNAAVIEALKARDDVSLVVLAARWALAAEGYRTEAEGGAPVVLAPADTPAAHDPSGNFNLFRDGLAKTVAAIRATGREVILLGGVPEIGWDVPQAIFRQQQLGRTMPPPPTRREVDARAARADRVLAELAAQPGVRLLEIAPRLCRSACEVSEDDLPLYRDDDHFSRFGSVRVLEPLFAEKVWPRTAGPL